MKNSPYACADSIYNFGVVTDAEVRLPEGWRLDINGPCWRVPSLAGDYVLACRCDACGRTTAYGLSAIAVEWVEDLRRRAKKARKAGRDVVLDESCLCRYCGGARPGVQEGDALLLPVEGELVTNSESWLTGPRNGARVRVVRSWHLGRNWLEVEIADALDRISYDLNEHRSDRRYLGIRGEAGDGIVYQIGNILEVPRGDPGRLHDLAWIIDGRRVPVGSRSAVRVAVHPEGAD